MSLRYTNPFVDFCGNPETEVQLEARLFGNVPDYSRPVTLDSFEEKYFSGYRRVLSPAFIRRRVIGEQGAQADTGLLNWVVAISGNDVTIQGVYVVLILAGVAQLLGVASLVTPKRMTSEGDSLSLAINITNFGKVFAQG